MTTIEAGLEGRTALVTGATGGLGGHFARLLAARGARVVVAARRRDRLDRLATEITEGGGEALAVTMDVTDEDSVRRGFAAAEAAFGPVDILVNNSGIAGSGARALEVEAAEVEAVLAVDLTGAYRIATTCARRLVAAGRPGSIVNVASILGLRVSVGVASYAAAKAGLIRLTEALALEWARHGIRVNALCPGYIASPMNEAFLATPGGRALVQRIPQRRLGEPCDLDGPLLLLASEAGRYMTGSTLVVDGGHLVSAL